MEEIKLKLSHFLKRIDNQWQQLSLEKQHQYLLTFFLVYSLFSVVVFIKIGFDVVTKKESIHVVHIKQPLQISKDANSVIDSSSTIHKNISYEGK